MNTHSIKTLLEGGESFFEEKVLINAWVRAFRSYRFIMLNDGSTIKDLQVVVDNKFSEEFLKKITIGTALKISGLVVKSKGKEQTIEVLAKEIIIYSKTSSEDLQGTILQPKKHSLEKLREQAHLRFRTKFFSAVMRIRHQLAFSVHKYFHKRGFLYIHTPIITSSDAEGFGEMFRVTSLDFKKLPRDSQGQVDESQDFFGRSAYLTVSGQLEGESAAMALSKIYTFGPTFRAENSNTSRHLSEFWMIEPEVAFYELSQNMDLAEDFLKYLIGRILEHCTEDLDFLNQRFIEEQKKKPKKERLENTLIDHLKLVHQISFIRLSYSRAIEILLNSKIYKNGEFKHAVKWGMDLQSEHERYLVEKHFCAPLILFDYPADIKAFYMRLNEDRKTVRAMDILFPGLGEIIGGSQREERYEILLKRMQILGIDKKSLWWYLDTRRFGSAPHSGFGLGFERFVQFVTRVSNIRDVIPFPRTPKNAEF